MNIYQDALIDHFRNPCNKGTLDKPDFSSSVHNPTCGDSVSMQGIISSNVITDIKFSGKGCVISQAAASMLTVLCLNKPATEIQLYTAQTMKDLVGIELGPVRVRCALLALEAVQQGIYTYSHSLKDTHA